MRDTRHDELYDLHEQYDPIPERILKAIRDYVELGSPPGAFLRGVLEDSLQQALGAADPTNRDAVYEVGLLVWNRCPAGCWGSAEKVDEWVERGGLSDDGGTSSGGGAVFL